MPHKYSKADIAKMRIEKADVALRTARLNMEFGDYTGAANRSYYAVFYAIESLLIFENITFKRHSGVISYFNQHFIKSNLLQKELAGILKRLFEVRQKSDYEDFFELNEQQILKQIVDAEYFVSCIRTYLKNMHNM
jgi:uncharacterized protein (UPF0332 family)